MAKIEKNELIKARCLQRFTHEGKEYLVNDIYTGSQDDIKSLTENGLIDSHKDAVSYAESLK
ncbi:MAG: hypothetical protein V4570_06355 [Pseudomonadota bacterium]